MAPVTTNTFAWRRSGDGIAHDPARRDRNTTAMPPDEGGDWDDSYTLTWDGWNRLVKVEEGTTEIAAYAYDGLYRRTEKTISGTTRHYYYSNRWKPLEERISASADAERQYVWGTRPEHRDELILRDRDTDANGTLDERLYCAMDYYNPTSILDTSGVVQERYGFTGFGIRRIMDANFDPLSASAFDVDFAYKGQFVDDETGYHDYGYRYYSPQIGRWLSKDPIGRRGGINEYAFGGNNEINSIDFLGLIEVVGKFASETLNELQFTEKGAETIARVKRLEEYTGLKVRIKEGTMNVHRGRPTDRTDSHKYEIEISKNPPAYPAGNRTDGRDFSVIPGPIEVLHHELIHAIQNLERRAQRLRSVPHCEYRNMAEKEAIEETNKLREELNRLYDENRPARTHY